MCVACRAIDKATPRLVEYALSKQLSQRIARVARRHANDGLLNKGRDVVDAVISLLLQSLRRQDSRDGIALCHAFRFVVDKRTIDCIRQERAQRRLFTSGSTDALSDVADMSAQTPASLDQILDLQGALDSIRDPGQRRVVELRLQGYIVAEIAGELGIGIDAATYRLNAGMGEVINNLGGEAHS